MTNGGRLDTIDLIVRILLEHEKTLSNLLYRLEEFEDRLEENVERLEKPESPAGAG